MVMYKLRNPDKYPATWHATIRLLDAKLQVTPEIKSAMARLTTAPTRRQIEIELRRSQAFRMNLRKHPLHPTSQLYEKYETKCSLHETLLGWELWITLARPSELDLTQQILTA